ncbi:MAG: hypothetical protein RSG58_06920 [Eubacterium sp.]
MIDGESAQLREVGNKNTGLKRRGIDLLACINRICPLRRRFPGNWMILFIEKYKKEL